MPFFRSCIALSVTLLLLCTAPSAPPAAQDGSEEFGIKEQPVRKETVLDLIFGSTPEMPTERGILVIDAYEDLDNNGKRGEDERELRNEITCQIDKIDYSVPAFIPGLDYNNRYEIRCSGKNFYPTMPNKEILVKHRGQVIEIDLPCRRNEVDKTASD